MARSSFEEVSSDSRESFLRYDFTLLRSKLIVFTTLISHLYGVWLPSALKRYPISPLRDDSLAGAESYHIAED